MAGTLTWLLLPSSNLGLGCSADLLGSVLPLLLLLPAHLSLGFDDALNNTGYLLTEIKQNSKSWVEVSHVQMAPARSSFASTCSEVKLNIIVKIST